uniref:Ranatensin-R n=1 Tax=Glandirana rugosa TaxID=8410 RepID=RANR_GLARU|nr:RecName: Full=Ranatensin-R [Glandirana rugosa]prf//0504195A ranatensin R [Glandirana rugosa]
SNTALRRYNQWATGHFM